MNKGGVYFLPDGEKFPKLYTKREMEKHNAVYLPPYMFDVPAHSLITFRVFLFDIYNAK